MVGRLVWCAALVDLKDNDASAVVKGNLVDPWENRRLDLIAADIDKLFFDLFGIVQPFYPPLIVDAKDYGAAPGICQRHYFRDNFVGIYQPDLEFEVCVLSSPNQAEQIISIKSSRIAPGQFLLEQRALAVGDAPGRPE